MDELIDHSQRLPAKPFAPATDDAAPLDLVFSGSGAEYFRIWIVNLLLTVATFGLYSAWAKTRRLQYFYRNTQLAGASFDFRGNPYAILRGRLLALVLVAVYHYAFGWSLKVGMVVAGLLLLALPFLMRAALRFRLTNTWYRGLPFGFDGGVAAAYAVYLPPIALFVVPGILAGLGVDPRLIPIVFLLYLAWPLMHGAMKRYQHRHLMVGNQVADFPLSIGQLALPYVFAFLMGLGAIVVVGIVAAVAAGFVTKGGVVGAIAIAVGVLLFYLSLLMLGPYVTVRINNRTWSATSFPGIGIESRMTVRGYLKLQVVNVLLTLLTLGLFRPFAAVRTWRYRVTHMRIAAPDGFEQVAAGTRARPVAAVGDGVADFFDVDLSW